MVLFARKLFIDLHRYFVSLDLRSEKEKVCFLSRIILIRVQIFFALRQLFQQERILPRTDKSLLLPVHSENSEFSFLLKALDDAIELNGRI